MSQNRDMRAPDFVASLQVAHLKARHLDTHVFARRLAYAAARDAIMKTVGE